VAREECTTGEGELQGGRRDDRDEAHRAKSLLHFASNFQLATHFFAMRNFVGDSGRENWAFAGNICVADNAEADDRLKGPSAIKQRRKRKNSKKSAAPFQWTFTVRAWQSL